MFFLMCLNFWIIFCLFPIQKTGQILFLFLRVDLLRPNISILFPSESFWIFLLTVKGCLWDRLSDVDCNKFLRIEDQFCSLCSSALETKLFRKVSSFSKVIFGIKWFVEFTGFQAWDYGAILVLGRLWLAPGKWSKSAVPRIPIHLEPCPGCSGISGGSILHASTIIQEAPVEDNCASIANPPGCVLWRSHGLQMRNLETQWIANLWSTELMCIDYQWTRKLWGGMHKLSLTWVFQQHSAPLECQCPACRINLGFFSYVLPGKWLNVESCSTETFNDHSIFWNMVPWM